MHGLAFLLAVHTAYAGAVASSFRAETKLGANYWNAQAATDGKLDTCWMLPGESNNKGEWVQLDVPKGEIDKIAMVIGWARSDETFADYARVKEVKIEAYTLNDQQELVPASSTSAVFEDRPGMQVVDIENLSVGEDLFGGKVKITIVDTYPGRDFPNLAISELLLQLKEFEAQPKVEGVSGSLDGYSADALADRNPKTFWAADGTPSIRFSASGFGLSSVGLVPVSKDWGRPKKVQVTVGSRTETYDLPDATTVQWVTIPSVTGYTGSAWGTVELKVLEIWPGAKNAALAASELKLNATTFEGL